jgi:hypothetical protein
MNFLVKSELYKAFFTYYEKLLTKNMKNLYIYFINFVEQENIYLIKREKTQNKTFLE